MRPGWTFALLITSASMLAGSARAWDRLALDNVPAPAPLFAEEPLARSFSLESAARSLDVGALHWQKTRKCAACHTLVPYLMARPSLAAVSPEHGETGTGKLHPLTRQALDRMWGLQRADGGWQRPFRETQPFKSDEHFGVTLAAVGIGPRQRVSDLRRRRQLLVSATAAVVDSSAWP